MNEFTRLYWSVRRGVRRTLDNLKRCITYLPVIWNDRDFDQSFFYELMAFKLKRMENRMVQCRPDVVKDLRQARILCERMSKEKYINWGYKNERDEVRSFKGIIEREDYLFNQDLELFGKILRKHSRTWWD